MKRVEFEGDFDREIQIEEDAFENYPNLIFVAKAGDIVERFTNEHDIVFEAKE